jgi:hypothetical protein
MDRRTLLTSAAGAAALLLMECAASMLLPAATDRWFRRVLPGDPDCPSIA